MPFLNAGPHTPSSDEMHEFRMSFLNVAPRWATGCVILDSFISAWLVISRKQFFARIPAMAGSS